MIFVVMERCTSARSKTPASAAYCACRTICRSRSPSSSARPGRGAVLERVVDLVGLLEQERLQRLVVLLAVPGAAVGLPQPMHEPGQAEGAGDVGIVGEGRQQVRGRGQRAGVQPCPTVRSPVVPRTGWSAG